MLNLACSVPRSARPLTTHTSINYLYSLYNIKYLERMGCTKGKSYLLYLYNSSYFQRGGWICTLYSCTPPISTGVLFLLLFLKGLHLDSKEVLKWTIFVLPWQSFLFHSYRQTWIGLGLYHAGYKCNDCAFCQYWMSLSFFFHTSQPLLPRSSGAPAAVCLHGAI